MADEITSKAVFLITIDALNLNHLKVYGYNRNTAPNLEKFITQGSIFINAFTNGPETPSSFSSIFSSILPFLNGGYSPMPSHKLTFPQILKENNISTYGIHSNPNLGEFFHYDRGFDVFLDGERYKIGKSHSNNMGFKQHVSFTIRKIVNFRNLFKSLIYRLYGFNKIKDFLRKKFPLITELLLLFTPIAYNAPYIVNKIESYLREGKSKIFFWAHFMDLHSPYNPPSENIIKFRQHDFTPREKEFLNKNIYSNPSKYRITQEIFNDFNILYDAQINFLDEYLGHLFKIIKRNFRNNCLIIITADHGEALLKHGSTGHQGSIHDDLLKIPLFIIETGKKSSLKKIEAVVEGLDISCTILNYFDIEIPETYQGRSLIPLINGDKFKEKNFIISECYQKNGLLKRNNNEGYKLISIKKDNFKFVFNEENDTEFLFDIKSDPQEIKNLIKIYPSKANKFREIKNQHLINILESTSEKSKIIKAIPALNLKKIKL